MNDITIAIHESKGSDKVMKFISLDKFTKGFIDAYNSGHIWGCYYSKTGSIVAHEIGGKIRYRILSKRKAP